MEWRCRCLFTNFKVIIGNFIIYNHATNGRTFVEGNFGEMDQSNFRIEKTIALAPCNVERIQ